MPSSEIQPLVPAECDLRGYDFMPLFGNRLFNSSFDAKASDAEFRAALKLWWASWLEVPAASLPDDDIVLAKLAGYGRDIKGWRKVRSMALHGFVLCTDGRLYHQVLAPEAVRSYERRKKSDMKRTTDRSRLQKWRDDKRADETPSHAVSETHEKRVSDGVSGDVSETRFVGGRQDRDRTEEKEEPRAGVGEKRVSSDVSENPPEPERQPSRLWQLVSPTEWSVWDDGRKVPAVGGYNLVIAAERVGEAAGINDATWAGDWRPLVTWLREGFDLHDEILPAIKRCAARERYQPPGSLGYFDRAIRENRSGKRGAA